MRFAIATAVLATTSMAVAGTHLSGLHTGPEAPAGRRVDMHVQDGKLRVTGHPSHVLHYDHATKTAWIVDTVAKTSIELNEARIRQLGDQVAQARRSMDANMRGLSDERRARLEGLFQRGGMAPPPAARTSPLTFSKAGSGTVGAWTCDRYAASDEGRTVETCTTSTGVLGIPESDAAVLEGFVTLMRTMAERASAMGTTGIVAERGVPGFPLERRESRDGRATDHFVMQSIAPATLPAADLERPSDLRPVMPGTPAP